MASGAEPEVMQRVIFMPLLRSLGHFGSCDAIDMALLTELSGNGLRLKSAKIRKCFQSPLH
jgi:hypothetical protein